MNLPVDELSNTYEENEFDKITFEEYVNDEEEESNNEDIDPDIIKELLLSDKSNLTDILSTFISECRDINYMDYMSSMENGPLAIYSGTSIENRMMLLNVIISCLCLYGYSDEELIEITKNIVQVYNNINIVFLQDTRYNAENIFLHDENLYNSKAKYFIHNLTVLNDDMIDKITRYYKKEYTMTENENALFYLQLFTYASIFIDVDKLLYIVSEQMF